MNSRKSNVTLIASVGVAAALWFFTFRMAFGVFWFKISISAAVLGTIAVVVDRQGIDWRFKWRDIVWGVGSAALLYGIFLIGYAVSSALFDFAPDQVQNIYLRGSQVPRWMIYLLLLFVTSPAEEIYWRGFLQRNLAEKLGAMPGWLCATALYALVHLPAWNFMLIAAAAVAGAFWGLLYWRLGRIAPLIISHAVWSVTIFLILPVP